MSHSGTHPREAGPTRDLFFSWLRLGQMETWEAFSDRGLKPVYSPFAHFLLAEASHMAKSNISEPGRSWRIWKEVVNVCCIVICDNPHSLLC